MDYKVTILDKSRNLEWEIFTSAATPERAKANAISRLHKAKSPAKPLALFWSQNKDRYSFTIQENKPEVPVVPKANPKPKPPEQLMLFSKNWIKNNCSFAKKS